MALEVRMRLIMHDIRTPVPNTAKEMLRPSASGFLLIFLSSWAVALGQLVEQSLPTPYIRGSNHDNRQNFIYQLYNS